MRLTFLLTQDLDSPGGAGRFFPLAQELAQLGYQITILALHPNFKALTPDARHMVREGIHVHYVAQMHVRKVGGQKSYFNPLQLVWVVLWATLRLAWVAWHTPTDLFFVGKTQPMNLLAAWFVYRFRGAAVWVDSDDYEAVHNRFGAGWQQQMVAWFENWPVGWANGFSVGNRFIYERYRVLGVPPERLLLLYNGVDIAQWSGTTASEMAALRQQLPFAPSDPLVVYVGSMRLTTHAVDLLLQAWAEVHTAVFPARLLLVGGGEDEAKVREIIQQMNLGETVYMTGFVPPTAVAPYYHLAQFSIDPRRDNLAARASFPLKLVESIAAGVPCLLADIGDRAHIGQQACYLIPPDSAPALAQAIIYLLKQPSALAQIRQAAHELRPQLAWENRARQCHQQWQPQFPLLFTQLHS